MNTFECCMCDSSFVSMIDIPLEEGVEEGIRRLHASYMGICITCYEEAESSARYYHLSVSGVLKEVLIESAEKRDIPLEGVAKLMKTKEYANTPFYGEHIFTPVLTKENVKRMNEWAEGYVNYSHEYVGDGESLEKFLSLLFYKEHVKDLIWEEDSLRADYL